MKKQLTRQELLAKISLWRRIIDKKVVTEDKTTKFRIVSMMEDISEEMGDVL